VNIVRIYKLNLFFCILFISIGGFLKIMHWQWSDIIYLGYLFGIIITIIALFKLYKSQKLSLSAKLLWGLGIMFLGWIFHVIFYYKKLKPNKL
jgi:hypothetical protein